MMTNKTFISPILSSSIALVALAVSGQAFAAGCEVNLEVTTAMAYTTKSIDVPKTCKDFTINLKADGTMPKAVMGHNVVITKTADEQAVLDDGSKAGVAGNYVKAKDARVVAATNLVGGGEATSTKFAVSKLNAKDSYVFFCSFPGHAMMMKGVLKLV